MFLGTPSYMEICSCRRARDTHPVSLRRNDSQASAVFMFEGFSKLKARSISTCFLVAGAV
jgi:hypothetical protein